MSSYIFITGLNNYKHSALLKNFKRHPRHCGISLAKYIKQVILPLNTLVMVSENKEGFLHNHNAIVTQGADRKIELIGVKPT